MNRHSNDISTFIAIGDGSFHTAKEILDTIPEVKVVIYGNGYVNSDDNDREVTSKVTITLKYLESKI